MEKNEILAAIRENIAGQGSMVDISGKLPGILEALVEGAEFAQKTTITLNLLPKKLEGSAFVEDSEAEGTIIVKGFSAKGETLPVREIPFSMASGSTLEIEATIGDTIGVVGKVPGKGASCQYVQKVVGPVTIHVEIYPAGIYELSDGYLSPTISGDGYNGCAVVTEDFAILLPPYQREGWNKDIPWGGLGQRIPFVLKASNSIEAIADFDGALNTAAILSVVNDEYCAAKVATIMTEPINYMKYGMFLPSAGILKYLYDNRSEINNFIVAARDEYNPEVEYDLLPSGNSYWTSTDYADEAAVCAWYVTFGLGNVGDNNRHDTARTFAVFAFQTFI